MPGPRSWSGCRASPRFLPEPALTTTGRAGTVGPGLERAAVPGLAPWRALVRLSRALAVPVLAAVAAGADYSLAAMDLASVMAAAVGAGGARLVRMIETKVVPL